MREVAFCVLAMLLRGTGWGFGKVEYFPASGTTHLNDILGFSASNGRGRGQAAQPWGNEYRSYWHILGGAWLLG